MAEQIVERSVNLTMSEVLASAEQPTFEIMKQTIAKAIFTVLLLFVVLSNYAQCAMCRATAESATNSVDKGIGEGLNSGIVYLMGVPYMLLIIGALVFYRKKISAFFRG